MRGRFRVLCASAIGLLWNGCAAVPGDCWNDRASAEKAFSSLSPSNWYAIVRRQPTELSWEQAAIGPLRPIVRVRVNGRLALALIDTGSSASLISESGARRLGVCQASMFTPLPQPGQVPATTEVQGLGATTTGSFGRIERLELGGVSIANVPVVVTDSFSLEYRPGHRVELLLGCDVWRAIGTVQWRGPQRRVVLAPAKPPPHNVQWLALRPDFGVPLVPAMLNGEQALWVALDSGGDFDLWISGPLARQLGLPPPNTERYVPRMTGVGGRVLAYPIGAASLRIGSRTWDRVQVLVGATGQGHAHLPFALLGLGVLGHEVIWLDFESGRIGLPPRPSRSHACLFSFFGPCRCWHPRTLTEGSHGNDGD